MIGAALEALERLLLPNCCVSCGRVAGPAESDSLVCAPCRARMRTVPAGCARCWQPLPPVGPCRFCADWPAALAWVRSAVWLDDQAREIVHHLKYQSYTLLAHVIAAKMRSIAKPDGPVLLVPIPLSPARLRTRGFNQAEVITRALAVHWQCGVEPGVLVRIRDTKTQTKLTPEQRKENMGGAFFASPCPASPPTSVREPPTPPHIILVDDVLTTGATLVAAASALQDAGWSRVGAVTFARALTYVARVEST